MIDWWNCGFSGSQVLVFQTFYLSVMSYVYEYVCTYEYAHVCAFIFMCAWYEHNACVYTCVYVQCMWVCEYNFFIEHILKEYHISLDIKDRNRNGKSQNHILGH